MPRSCIKILGMVVWGIPRSASSSSTVNCQSLLIAAQACSTFLGVLFVAGLPECGSLSTYSQPSSKHFYFHRTRSIIPKSLLNHPNSFHRRMFKLNANLDADSLLYTFILHAASTQYRGSHNGVYSPHWLVQCSVKSSLFMDVHSSPLSLTDRLLQCHTKHSHYNKWLDFSRTDLVYAIIIYLHEVSFK